MAIGSSYRCKVLVARHSLRSLGLLMCVACARVSFFGFAHYEVASDFSVGSCLRAALNLASAFALCPLVPIASMCVRGWFGYYGRPI